MQGKQAVDKTMRGIERGQWMMQGHIVEVAALHTVGQCDGERMRLRNDTANAIGRQRNNAANRAT